MASCQLAGPRMPLRAVPVPRLAVDPADPPQEVLVLPQLPLQSGGIMMELLELPPLHGALQGPRPVVLRVRRWVHSFVIHFIQLEWAG